jgi:hypothetical protein
MGAEVIESNDKSITLALVLSMEKRLISLPNRSV